MKRYSEDLRWRVIWALFYESQTKDQAAKRFYLSRSSVQRIKREFMAFGTVSGTNGERGRKQLLNRDEIKSLFAILGAYPTSYLWEIQTLLAQELGW